MGGSNESSCSYSVFCIPDVCCRKFILVRRLCCTTWGYVRNGQYLRVNQGQEVLWWILHAHRRDEKEEHHVTGLEAASTGGLFLSDLRSRLLGTFETCNRLEIVRLPG
jgi:hypothetical protein